MATIAVLGTLDTKGDEHAFVADQIRLRGHEVLLIDVGTGSDPGVRPGVSRFEVAEAGGIDLQPILDRRDRGECVAAMTRAAPILLARLVEKGTIEGVISLGGGGGTAIATAAMRVLPIGFPKVMVSTLASGNTAHYVGTRDIVMIPSIVDVSGLNSVSRTIFTRAAGAISGMVDSKVDISDARPIIAASMFGNTTDLVSMAREQLEAAGYEVLVFHATGTGGRTMEALIESGMVAGVLDVTTTEWADELVGGVLAAGSDRLDAMTRAAVPAVIAPGCLDMVNFGERETVPAEFEGRAIYQHNPQVTLVRTSAEECDELGRILARKANANGAPTAILIPARAISLISAPGEVFHDPAADAELFKAIRGEAEVEVQELEVEINSEEFANACVRKLLELMEEGGSHPQA
ncbi:MAG: Tm-1-like ATP-binding domain-containing protein [Roseibacillus sp.]|nr:Tm-1-like ATP-binding domain-containing protein [Roseibacillus sp.]